MCWKKFWGILIELSPFFFLVTEYHLIPASYWVAKSIFAAYSSSWLCVYPIPPQVSAQQDQLQIKHELYRFKGKNEISSPLKDPLTENIWTETTEDQAQLLTQEVAAKQGKGCRLTYGMLPENLQATKSIYKQYLEPEKQLLKSCIYSKTFHSIHEGLYFIPAFAFTPVLLWMWYFPASGNPNDIHWAQMQTVLPRGKPQAYWEI